MTRGQAKLGSTNPGKLRELRALLPDWDIVPAEASLPEETGVTFYENARAKAVFAHEPGGWTLGEDSGLEVDGLGGAPGIRSARYAGPEATDDENVRKLITALVGSDEAARRARYVSELVCVMPNGDELRGSGTLEGTIALEPQGSGGFGYDPVFIPTGEEQTVAELGDEWKRQNSHRARSAAALLHVLGEAASAR